MQTHAGAQNICGCRPAHLPAIRAPAGSSSPNALSPESKYFQEIGAEMIGNQLIIRVEKDRSRSSKRKAGQWDPPCDCPIPEIKMPSATKGPRIVNAGDNNQILFRIRSRNLVGKDDTNYKPEAFAYQLGAAKKGRDDQHRTITIHPQLGDPAASQEVHSDHITDGNQNIYLLRVNKKSESANQRRRNIELELTTPKAPPARKLSEGFTRKTEVPKPTVREVPAETMNGAKEAGNNEEKKEKKEKKKKK